jgi:hypothetical protein
MRGLAALLMAVPVAACVTSPAPAPPAGEAVKVPPGCEANQSGSWVHASNEAFRYRAADDGGALVLTLDRGDGGTGEPEVVLARTPAGFRGATYAAGFNATGRECRVAFPTEVSACSDGGLLLRAAAKASIDDACQPPSAAAPPSMVEQPLVRVP